jgi:hypothetical protein
MVDPVLAARLNRLVIPLLAAARNELELPMDEELYAEIVEAFDSSLQFDQLQIGSFPVLPQICVNPDYLQCCGGA